MIFPLKALKANYEMNQSYGDLINEIKRHAFCTTG